MAVTAAIEKDPMPLPNERTNATATSVADDLQLVCDDVEEFHQCCAMLCDAFASTSEEGSANLSASASAQTLSCWMKERMERLSVELKRIQRKADAQRQHS